MDSILIYQAANDLVQNTGTRNIKRIARSCSLDILETPRFKDVLGFLSLHFDKPLILINSHLDSQTKQMVCGYALGHYLEHQILMDLHTLNKSLAITDLHILQSRQTNLPASQCNRGAASVGSQCCYFHPCCPFSNLRLPMISGDRLQFYHSF